VKSPNSNFRHILTSDVIVPSKTARVEARPRYTGGMKQLSLALAIGVCVACGGKTDGGDGTGGSGGGGASGGGAGGVSGGGAGGVSGGGAGGVSGGGAGGVSGSGGSGGLASAVCDKLDQLPCAQPNCLSELDETRAEADKLGCSAVFTKLLQCVVQSPIGCSSDGNVELSPECSKVAQEFGQCISQSPPPECSGFSDGVVCGVLCDEWAATCKILPSGLSCECTAGPNAGVGFSLNDQTCGSPGLSVQLEDFCSVVFD
jgi:hypothetical protein